MSEPLDDFSSCPPLPTGEDHTTTDPAAINTPVSDFRRNEARHILADDERHKSIYHQPSLTAYGPNERRRKRHRRIRQGMGQNDLSFKPIPSSEANNTEQIQSPGARVQFLLGDEDQEFDDEEHKPHDLFIELNELITEGEKTSETGDTVDHGWKETARWVKFEEDVESGGRWSKPHVATLSLHSLLELRNFISKGSVILDMHADQLPVIVDMILDDMITNNLLPAEKRFTVRSALLLKHVHQHEKEFHRHLHSQEIKKPLPFTRSLAEFSRNRSQKDITAVATDHTAIASAASSSALPVNPNQSPSHTVKSAGHTSVDKFLTVAIGEQSKPKIQEGDESTMGLSTAESRVKINLHFMKKVPANAEATNVLVGAVDFLHAPIYAFVRLAKGVTLPDLVEVALPTRFLFILLGPCSEHSRYHEVGRSIATIMADEIFHDVAYRARNRDDLLAGIDDFLDYVTVLPPGEWDPTTRIEPPKSVPKKEDRLERKKANGLAQTSTPEHTTHEFDPALSRTGRFCGGLIQDLKRKAPFYLSDFVDGISFQSLAAIIFLYFACLSPIITFGGLLSKATDNNMAAIESLLSGAVCGILYHLFAGQPLTILGSTGPVLVFETIVNHFCTTYNFDYMNFRCWIGLWTATILFIMVLTDASYLVKYITRFTEESFAALIGIIFIYEAFDKMIEINTKHPIQLRTLHPLPANCTCKNPMNPSFSLNWTTPLTLSSCFENQAYYLEGPTCGKLSQASHVSDVFLFSVILFLSTFTLAYTLKNFKFSRFLSMSVRSRVSDFGVVLAIFLNVFFDYMMGLNTPKLNVPRTFATTKPGRGWIINPFGKNPVYMWFAAALPALLATILIFMDQQITAVIINRKENKLKKGCGYHLDLLIVTICIVINSILGLPWFVAATVLSINHVIALKLESETAAPGEKPKFLGVREQRLTGFVVFVFIGLSVFLTRVLAFIPMPVLYGVFLYMGISSMKEIQLVSRILLMFMPEKYQPDYVYLRHVRTSRVHIFTLIQLSCLALLWIIKSIKKISILFPIMVLALVGARKLMDYIFTQRELEYLDDIMPEIVKKEIEERRNSLAQAVDDDEKGDETMTVDNGEIRITVNDGAAARGRTDSTKVDPSSGTINFSEEVGKTFLWKSIAKPKDKEPKPSEKKEQTNKQSPNEKQSRGSALKKRIRKLSISILGPDEERPLVTQTNEVAMTSINQQLPSIVVEQTDSHASNDTLDQHQRTSSTTSNNNETTKM